MIQRLRFGFRLAYQTHTGNDEFASITPTWAELRRFETSLIHEADRYEFRDTEGKSIRADEALNTCLVPIWRDDQGDFYAGESSGVRAVYVIDRLAESIQRRYQITPRDRRGQSA